MSAIEAVARSGLRETIWFEWTKFATVRSTVALSTALGLVLPVLAVLVAATGSLQLDDTILGASLLGGAVIAQVVAVALGALTVTGELSSGTIRTTFTACPRRAVVLTAKAIVTAGIVFAITLPSAITAFGAGLFMLDEGTYARGEPFPALFGVTLAITSIAVLGVAIGTVVRRSAAAVAAGISVVLLPGLLAPLLGDHQRWLGGASLNGVMQKMTQSSDATHDAVGSLGAWPSLAVVALYTVITFAVAAGLLCRRDA